MTEVGLLSNRLFICLWFLFFGFKPAQGNHVVGFANWDYVSHSRVLWKLGKELQGRGHKYTQILPSCAKEIYQDIDVKIFNTSVTNEEIENVMINLMKVGDVSSLSGAMKLNQLISDINLLVDRFCEDLLKSTALITELKTADLVLCDSTNVCCFILSDVLNVSRVDVSPVGFAGALGAHIFQFPHAPVYLTLESSSGPFSFKNRLTSFLTYTLYTLIFKNLIPQNLWEVYAKPTSRYSNAVESLKNQAICLIPHDFALEYPRPLGANVKVIGPILPEPAHELPDYFDKFMNENSNVVVVSFGTTLSKYRPALIQVIADGLAGLPFAVLWKHLGDMPTTIGNNTKIVAWIPQNDILANPSTKLFVTHCGLNSFLESAYHSVPMVAIPLFGDQHRQASIVHDKGLGIVLDKNSMDPKDLTKAIFDVFNSKLYKENAKRISVLLKDRKRTPQEEGADWIEYALRHNGAPHLISEVLDLDNYQLYMFDIFLFLTVLVFLISFLILRLCHWVCCRKSTASKEKKA